MQSVTSSVAQVKRQQFCAQNTKQWYIRVRGQRMERTPMPSDPRSLREAVRELDGLIEAGDGYTLEVEDYDFLVRLRALLAAVPEPEALGTETKWRRLLWLRHGCDVGSLYGDDGEMQCSACRLDFKRMAPEEIERIWRSCAEREVRAARAAQRGNSS